MTNKDLALVALLGACGGLGVLTTGLFHAFIPLPGFGAVLFMPLSTACLIIARDRINHAWAAGLTKLVQQIVIFFLPGGPMLAHNPFLIPLNAADGFLFDGLYRLWPWSLSEKRLLTGVVVAGCGAVGGLLQIALIQAVAGQQHFFLSQGVWFFLAVFIGLHSLLRGVGAWIGALVLRSIPSRTC